jgi:hypothetical protein
MLGKLNAAAKLAREAGTVLTQVAAVHGSDAINWAAGKLPDIETLSKQVCTLKVSYTAIPVKAVCEQQGDGPNDYQLIVDIDEIATALNEGRVATPAITVYAKFPNDLDRDLLADRMQSAFVPLLHSYRAHVDKKKKALAAKERKANEMSFWEQLDLAIIIAIFPPIILLLLALDFVSTMKRLPSLLLKKFSGDDEMAKLDAELDDARATLKTIIRNMKIEQLP